MKRKRMRRGLSLFLSLLMCFGTLLSMSTTVLAATEVDAYMIDFPRDGDVNYSATAWGHSAASLMSGWHYSDSDHMVIHCLGSYEGQVAYCIEPGVSRFPGDTLSGLDESFWENYPADKNMTITPDTIKVLLGRIMQYGYQGNVSTSWRTQDASAADKLSHVLATQLLVWETVVGERDASFNKVDPSAYGRGSVLSYIRADHPLRSQIMAYYNSMVTSVQNHTKVPSFCSRSYGSANSYELKWNGNNYSTTLTDTNGVLANFTFSASQLGINFSKSGNRLTITADTAVVGDIRVSASKASGTRSGVITWTDGNIGNQGRQDVVTYGENVSDPVNAYMILEMEAVGTMHLVKTSEDGVVTGIPFTITGNGITRTVETGPDGTIDITDLIAGVYTVTEASIGRYTPQSSQQVTIVGGQTSTVTFSNTLKRGTLEVVKSAEDGFVEGVKFHLYGVSLSGLTVDEYAVTNANGVARFNDVLISGAEPYTIEEVDTAIRYVIPDTQTVQIQWNQVAERSFTNILKKFTVTVTKADAESGVPQGDATLAGAKYGIYKGGELVDVYFTDANGQFTTREYVCDTDWTLQEIESSDGYLLDPSVHSVGADPGLYSIEHNATANGVTEVVIKGSIRLVKHIDAENPDVEIIDPQPEPSPTEEPVFREAPSETESDDRQATVEEAQTSSSDQSDAEGEDEAPISEDTISEAAPDATVEQAEEETHPPAQEKNEENDLQEAPDLEPGQSEESSQMEENELTDPTRIPVDELEASGNEGIIEQPEEGARFQIYLSSAGSYSAARESERDLVTTDADGFAESKDLPYGRYTVHQVEGMPGQAFIPDFTVYIREHGQMYSYILNNQTITSLIRVEKHDAETGKIIPASGIGFQIRDLASGELISQTLYYPTPMTLTTFYTSDDGTLMLPCELPYGRYELLEVDTCYGYVLDMDPVPFEVDGNADVVVVTKYNMPQKGVIQIRKSGEVFSSVTSDGGIYQPVYSVEGLAGATYVITALEDIYTPDGTLRASAGELVDTITTDTDGIASSCELYLGKYVITETHAPFGMVLNSETQTVELVYAGQEISLTETSADFYNERQHIEITMEKTMEADKLFDIGTGGEISNVTFGLYAAETLNAADGTSIPADGLLEIVSVNKDGSAICRTDLPFGSYYLQELATDSHYLISDARFPVAFAYAGQSTRMVTILVNDGAPIINKLLYGSVSGLKTDEDGKGLAGAVIGLFEPAVKEYSRETALVTTSTDADGAFRFDKVPFGNWIIREIEQPEGYVLCTEVFPVSISKDAQVIEIELVNRWIRGNLMLTKYDADYPGNKLTGAVFEVYRDTNGNRILDKGDELLGTMEEATEGVYWMRDIRYGGVLVREKTAPVGFILDEKAYYVSIEKDGTSYEVESEAGKGFLNQALKGSLKIVKTTSDGKKEGFAFRVTGVNGYDMSFTTDANGEIFIENLRIGEYVVTELQNNASSGYKLADPVKVTLVANETLTVRVHNDKVTVDVPKTGDDAKLALWLTLTGLGAAGLGAALFLYWRKRKSRRVFADKK